MCISGEVYCELSRSVGGVGSLLGSERSEAVLLVVVTHLRQPLVIELIPGDADILRGVLRALTERRRREQPSQ